MRRVCCYTHHYYPENAHIRRDMETLVQAGYSVDIICLKRKDQSYREIIKGVNIYRIPVEHHRRGLLRYLLEYSTSFFFAAVTLTFLHLRKRYKVIEVNNMPDILVFATIIPKLLGAKVILYIFDNVPEYFAFNYGLPEKHLLVRFLRLCERVSTTYASHVIVTQSMAKRILESHGVPSKKMTVVLNVPNEGIFHPAVIDCDSKSNKVFRVMAHGEILYSYGYQIIVKTIPLLIDRIPGLQVKIVGQGEYLEELKRLAKELGVEKHLLFTGFIPHEEMPRAISEADVGVVSKIIDLMLPTKLFEYVAMGKPVISSAQPTIKDYFGSDSILFYEPNNEVDLAECIFTLYSKPDKAKSLVRQASIIYDVCRWKEMKKIYVSVYDSLSA